MKMSNAVWMLGMLGLVGCGSTVAGITGKQADAVNVATTATCDSYDKCGEIASGKKYSTRAECEADNRSFWNDRWPAASCDGKINGDKLEFCETAIQATSCDNFFDQLQTVYGKCAREDVCSGKQ